MRKFFFALSLLFCFNGLFADEGMWLLTLLNKKYPEMKKAGLRLSAEDIYNINKASLKDAIVQFGNGCTGEIVSEKGLILTNHHCGFGQIQAHSTVEHNYLRDGFWAMSEQEELPNPGLTVKFLVRIEDVTDKIKNALNSEMMEADRSAKIKEVSEGIEKEASENNEYLAQVKNFFGGNDYYLLVYQIYKDVRLVGAPPSSIGKFGGDTDNWMWPRHTGDFSMFRVYMSPDGKPAEYSPQNVPYRPKHALPVSIKGVKEGDFTMIMGYPGRTNRYMSSFGVSEAINQINPSIVKIRDKKLSVLRTHMSQSEEIRIKYASKYARTSNYWKYFIGQTKGLKQLKVVEKKQKIEQDFQRWVDQSSDRKLLYSGVLTGMEKDYGDLKDYKVFRTYASEAGMRGPDLFAFTNRFIGLYNLLQESPVNEEKKKSIVGILINETLDFYKDFDLETEKELYKEMLSIFAANVNPDFYPTIVTGIMKKYKGDFTKYTDEAFTNSLFFDKTSVLSFLENPSFKKLDKDPIFKAMYSFVGAMKKFETIYQVQLNDLDKMNRLFIDGLRKMYPDSVFYPDANSTMRLTYGNALPYNPRDAVEFDLYTTLDGVMEKEDPSVDEFIVPDRLKELYRSENYGPYGENGKMHTCFLSTNDITGGNSGSPVLNGKGELIGLAFDGNWEAMSGDIAFETVLQRTISVDIRYVLFIIDKYAGASHLVKEMNIME